MPAKRRLALPGRPDALQVVNTTTTINTLNAYFPPADGPAAGLAPRADAVIRYSCTYVTPRTASGVSH